MRISTSSIYSANLNLLNQQQTQLLHTQQQIATQRRILTPSDDPIASARALEISQSDASNSQSIGEQYKQTLSQLQDLDFNKAISDLTQQKISLEAA
ncbi:MAG: hypothetical protein ABL875_03865 [Candidatus Nitrotoga sp.]